MESARVLKWAGKNAPSEDELMAIFRQEGLVPYAWSNGPGDRYAPHSHSYHKVIYVVSGSITFGLPGTGDRVHMSAGDRLDLPPGVTHDASVGPEGVVCLEAHR